MSPQTAPVLHTPLITQPLGELIDNLRESYVRARKGSTFAALALQGNSQFVTLSEAAGEADPLSTGLLPASMLQRTLARSGMIVDSVTAGAVMDLLLLGMGEVVCERNTLTHSAYFSGSTEEFEGALDLQPYLPIKPSILDDGGGVFVDWMLLHDLLEPVPPQPPAASGSNGSHSTGALNTSVGTLEEGEEAALIASAARHRLRLRLAHGKRSATPGKLSPFDEAHIPTFIVASVTLAEIEALVSRVGISHPASQLFPTAFPRGQDNTGASAAWAHSRGETWGAKGATLLPLLSLGDALEDEVACLLATRDLACLARVRGLLISRDGVTREEGGGMDYLSLSSPQAAQLRVLVSEFSRALVTTAAASTTPLSNASASSGGAALLGNSPFSPLDAAYTLALSRYGPLDEEERALCTALRTCTHFEGHLDVSSALLKSSANTAGGGSTLSANQIISRSQLRENLEVSLGILLPLSPAVLLKVALRCSMAEVGITYEEHQRPTPGGWGGGGGASGVATGGDDVESHECQAPYVYVPLFLRHYLDFSPVEFTQCARSLENSSRAERALEMSLARESVGGKTTDRRGNGGTGGWGERVDAAIGLAIELSHATAPSAPQRAAFSRHVMGALFSLGNTPLTHSSGLLLCRRYALSSGGSTPGLGFLLHADCLGVLLKGECGSQWDAAGEGEKEVGEETRGGSGRGLLNPFAADLVSSLAPPGATIRIHTSPKKQKTLQGRHLPQLTPPPSSLEPLKNRNGVGCREIETPSSFPTVPFTEASRGRGVRSIEPPRADTKLPSGSQWAFPYSEIPSHPPPWDLTREESQIMNPPTLPSTPQGKIASQASAEGSNELSITLSRVSSQQDHKSLKKDYSGNPPRIPSQALDLGALPSAPMESRLKVFRETGRWACSECYYESNTPFSTVCAMCTKSNVLLHTEVDAGEREMLHGRELGLELALGPLKPLTTSSVAITSVEKDSKNGSVCTVCAWDHQRVFSTCVMCASPCIEDSITAPPPPLSRPSPSTTISIHEKTMKIAPDATVSSKVAPPNDVSPLSNEQQRSSAASQLLQPTVNFFTDPWRTRHPSTSVLMSLKDRTPLTALPTIITEMGGRQGGGNSDASVSILKVSKGPFRPKLALPAVKSLEDSISTGLALALGL